MKDIFDKYLKKEETSTYIVFSTKLTLLTPHLPVITDRWTQKAEFNITSVQKQNAVEQKTKERE